MGVEEMMDRLSVSKKTDDWGDWRKLWHYLHGCWRDDGQIEHETVMEEKASVQVGVHLLGRLEEEDEEEKGYEL